MAAEHKSEVHSYAVNFWDCPLCGLRNTDSDRHIYLPGIAYECEHCDAAIELVEPIEFPQV